MALRKMGLDTPLLSILEDILDFAEEPEKEKWGSNPSRAYVLDAKAMVATLADVVEYPNRYVFVVDMPRIKAREIKAEVEPESILVVSGERKRDKDQDGVKYLSMERRVSKLMRKFSIPNNANKEKMSAVCQDRVLTVTVEKLPPPEPKRTKTIEVKFA